MITGLLLSIVCTLGVLRVVLTPTDQKDIIYRLARPCIRPNNLEPDWITCHASILKSTKWNIPQKKPRTAVLSYLCILLISLSSDIEANPGPMTTPADLVPLRYKITTRLLNLTISVSGCTYSVSP